VEAVNIAPRLALENILFATDFSSTSERAFAFASAIARCYGSKIFAVHAVTPEPHYSVPLEPVPLDLDPMWQQARKKMKHYQTTGAFGDINHEIIVEHGQAWDVVSRILRQHRIDLLVLGTHGRSGVRKLVLGSQAETIFRQAICPVLTVGPHVAGIGSDTWNPKRIIFASDLSPTSDHAFPFALSLAEETQACLTLLHLMPLAPPSADDDAEANALATLQKLIPADAENWCRPEFLARVDFPAEGILQVAEERNADVIVMGVRRRAIPTASAHLLWATASEVVSRACCPVLTVRG
jgi:nucleotide-binding universal stress UspA family protein